MGVAQVDGLTTHQRLQRFRQVAHFRHLRPIDQDSDHTNIASKRGLDFDRNEIVWSIKPAVTLLVSGIQPVGTDNGYENIARGNLIVEMSYEVDPRRNMIDIHEEIFPPETLGKSIVQPTGRAGRIVSAVIDENPSHHHHHRHTKQSLYARADVTK